MGNRKHVRGGKEARTGGMTPSQDQKGPDPWSRPEEGGSGSINGRGRT